ncbi:DUF5677 domain-containing protein [Neobacillus niacini]|uniref:DUF5677 domain-containing protein n=1 Tax=Neobacillus niacini TaxID=86668 RepID=UPI0030007DD2
MVYDGSKIKNGEIKYLFDSIFQKITDKIVNYPPSDNSLYWSHVMFQKFKIQYYSALQLTYNMTVNPRGQYEYLDIASINSIIRSCFETFLIFEHIYIHSRTSEERDLRLLLFQHDGYRSGRKLLERDKSSNEYRKYAQNCRITREKIERMNFFISLPIEERHKLLFGKWRPSWSDIIKETGLSNLMGKSEYAQLSLYAHNNFAALYTLDYYYQDLEKYNFDAINLHLYIVSTYFVYSILHLFAIRQSIFSEDELGIMKEFFLISKRES